MRVVIDTKTPLADSYGQTHRANLVHPHKEGVDGFKSAIIDFLSSIRNVKPGMEITIRTEDDWNV